MIPTLVSGTAGRAETQGSIALRRAGRLQVGRPAFRCSHSTGNYALELRRNSLEADGMHPYVLFERPNCDGIPSLTGRGLSGCRRGRNHAQNCALERMWTMRLCTRLYRLEQTIRVDRGCPACRLRRGRTVVLESKEIPDGTKAPLGDWPMPCTLCGELPEKIVEVVHLLPLEAPEEGAGDDRGWRSRRTRASGR
jgi:hypothetical protein